MPDAHDVAGEGICGSPATLSKRRGRKKRGGETKRSLGKRGSRDREGASAGGPGGFNDFLLVACSGPKNAGPSRPMACRGLRDLAKVGRRSLPWCAGRRGCAGRRWMGTGDAQAQAVQGRNRLQVGGELGSLGHTQSLTTTLPPTACNTHLTAQAQARGLQSPPGGSSNYIAGYNRHVFQSNRTWEAVPAQYLRQWTTGRHACKAKEQHRLESLLRPEDIPCWGIMGRVALTDLSRSVSRGRPTQVACLLARELLHNGC